MTDPIPLVGLVLLAVVLSVSVLCALTPTQPPQSRTRAVHSGRKSGRTAVQR